MPIYMSKNLERLGSMSSELPRRSGPQGERQAVKRRYSMGVRVKLFTVMP